MANFTRSCFLIACLLNAGLLFSQEWKVILYNNNFKPKGMFSIPMDSISYTNYKYLDFKPEDYFDGFNSCYLRLIPQSKKTLPSKSTNAAFLAQYSFPVCDAEYSCKNGQNVEAFEKYGLKLDGFLTWLGWEYISPYIDLPNGRWMKLDKDRHKIYEIEVTDYKLDGFVYVYHKNSANRVSRATQFSQGTWSKIEMNFEVNGEISNLYRHIGELNYYNFSRRSDGADREIMYPDNYSIEYDNDRKIYRYITMKNGNWNGPYINNYTDPEISNKEITEKGNYKENKKDGLWQYFDTENKVILEKFYEMDKLIWSKKY